MTDPAEAASQKFAVSFNINEQQDSFLVIKNTSWEEVRFYYSLTYSQEESYHEYMSPLTTIGPQELFVVDIKEIRDSGVPGLEGETLPSTVTFGHAAVVATHSALLVADPTFDLSSKTVTLCEDTCDDPIDPKPKAQGDTAVACLPQITPVGDVFYSLFLNTPRPDGKFDCFYRPCNPAECSRNFLDVGVAFCAPGVLRQGVIKIEHWFFFESCQESNHVHLGFRPCL
jgi:hypothetical protein